MASVAFVVHMHWKPKKIYFEYGEYTPAPVQVDLDTNLVFIDGMPVGINRDWARRVLAGKDIKAWRMGDGIITEMDLEDTSGWVIPIDKSLGAKGYVIRSSKVLRKRIAEQRKREEIEVCCQCLD